MQHKASVRELVSAVLQQKQNRFAYGAGLTEFPDCLYDLADTIEVLDLSNNNLTTLPKDFGKFSKLKILFLSNNQFKTLPAVIADCPLLSMLGFKSNQLSHIEDGTLPQQLRWLILTNNKLRKLPQTLGSLLQLQKVMLAGNQLSELPDLSSCQKLELLRISANNFATLPHWLLELPRLSWLAFAHTQFADETAPLTFPQIAWDALTLGARLGEGASGVIYKAYLNNISESAEELALKIFKGEVTSDGHPREEMRIWEKAGTHENLVAVRGALSKHPESALGLFFSLLPASFSSLGGPPNFETCTRDTYPEGTTFAISQVERILQQVNSVMIHLHKSGIMHGDLYAHNILRNPQDRILLSDFGAATHYSDRNKAAQFERLEVRAFGCLVEELLERTPETEKQSLQYKALREVQYRCMQAQVCSRPNFTEISEALSIR